MQLTINNKERQLVWGTGAFEDVCDRLDVSLVDFDIILISTPEKALYELTYSALRNGAEIKDESIDFNYKFFLSWLDQQEQDLGDKIMADFLESKYLGKTMRERFETVSAMLDASVNENEPKKPVKKKNTASVKL